MSSRTSGDIPAEIVKPARHRKWIVWTIAILVLILTLIIAPIELGKWYWNQVQQELEAKGEKLFASQFQKPAIADSDNYFAIPFYRECIKTKGTVGTQAAQLKEAVQTAKKEREIFYGGEGQTIGQQVSFSKLSKGLAVDASEQEKRAETLEWLERHLKPWDALRLEILNESERSLSNASVNLAEGFTADISFTSAVINLVTFCRLHSIAALEKRKTSDALQDIMIINRAVHATAEEPIMIDALVAMAAWGLAERTIYDGMQLWTDEELGTLDAVLKSLPFNPKRASEVLRTERATYNATIGNLIKTGKGMPGLMENSFLIKNYAYIPSANYNLTLQKLIELLASERGTPTDFDSIALKLSTLGKLEMWPHLFEQFSIPTCIEYLRKVFRYSDHARLTRVAIALERFHRRNGSYPSSLENLVPTYIERIPSGTIPGQTIQYSPLPGSGYKLWTFGWNGTDEGGTWVKMNDPSGDWVLKKDAENP